MESVAPSVDDGRVEILTNIGAVVTGLVTVVVGAFSVASIIFDDII